MKLYIESTQSFGTHTDSIKEEHECKMCYLNDGFEISYDEGTIKLVNNILIVKRDYLEMHIEVDKINVSKFRTPYGDVDVSVKGEKIEFANSPFMLYARYKLNLKASGEYTNELKLSIR